MNYTSWFPGNSSKTFPQFPVNIPSCVEMVKSYSSNIPATKPRKKDPNFLFNKKEIHQVSDHPSLHKDKQWLIKNHEAVKVDFDNLWIITELFALDDWRLICEAVGKAFPNQNRYKSPLE